MRIGLGSGRGDGAPSRRTLRWPSRGLGIALDSVRSAMAASRAGQLRFTSRSSPEDPGAARPGAGHHTWPGAPSSARTGVRTGAGALRGHWLSCLYDRARSSGLSLGPNPVAAVPVSHGACSPRTEAGKVSALFRGREMIPAVARGAPRALPAAAMPSVPPAPRSGTSCRRRHGSPPRPRRRAA